MGSQRVGHYWNDLAAAGAAAAADWSMLGFPVLRCLPEFAQTHVHWVSDAIKLSHPLSPTSPSALNLCIRSNLCIRWPNYWSFSISPSSEYSELIDLISLLSKGLSRVFSSATVQKHQFFSAQPSLWTSLVAQMVKNLPAMQETWVWSLGGDDPLEKGMATRSCILAWRNPWTEEPGGLQSVGLQRVRHDWAPSCTDASEKF